MKYFMYRTNELYHHGILGQKWGKRNGPPYPLKDGQKSSAEKKVEHINRSAEDFVGSIRSKKVGVVDPMTIYAVSMIVSSLSMIGLAYVYNKVEHRKMEKELESRKDNAKQKSTSDFPKLSKEMPPSESMKVTNPNYPNKGSVQNCTLCTAAMAMREKGFDVIAQKSDHPWYEDIVFGKGFNSPTVRPKSKNGFDLLRELNQHGDGAYGNLCVYWKNGGGHSIFWKNEGGHTRIYDGQSGDEYDVSDPAKSQLFKSIMIKESLYNRLDNCQPTDYILGIVESR